jgi:uncharacterized protein (TIGR00255 family)
MVNSMTGYGRGCADKDGRSFITEVKSVNNRYLDVSIKLPRQINALEDSVKKLVSSKISRGKVDIYISQDKFSDEDIEIRIDEQLAKAYFNTFKLIKDNFEVRDDISVSLLAKSPDVISINKKEEDLEEVWIVLKESIDNALNMFVDMRLKEGLKLSKDIQDRCEIIYNNVIEIESRASSIVEEYRQKISIRIAEYLKEVEVDQSKLLNEVAFFADRSNITEELVRLKSHLIQMKDALNSKEPVGRKLDFIIQEMNRETNTIGSKSNDLSITNLVVDIKCELEKIREQVQNIE